MRQQWCDLVTDSSNSEKVLVSLSLQPFLEEFEVGFQSNSIQWEFQRILESCNVLFKCEVITFLQTTNNKLKCKLQFSCGSCGVVDAMMHQRRTRNEECEQCEQRAVWADPVHTGAMSADFLQAADCEGLVAQLATVHRFQRAEVAADGSAGSRVDPATPGKESTWRILRANFSVYCHINSGSIITI